MSIKQYEFNDLDWGSALGNLKMFLAEGKNPFITGLVKRFDL